MLILSSPFSRNLVFFGVIDVILAVWGLYGFTRLINSQEKLRYRLMGVVIIVLVIILLIISSIFAVRYSFKG